MVRKPIVTKHFKQDFKKFKDAALLEKLSKQIRKIAENPEIGKPLRYNMRGERCIYIKPFRLIYAIRGDELILLKFSHRKNVYK